MKRDTLFDERSYLPFEVSELPAGAWLVASPHPDDECFGMGGAIALAKNNGIEVYVAFMTDGSLGGDPNIRELEAREASRLFGVKEIFFVNEKDRSLYPNDKNINFLADLIVRLGIRSVFFPHHLEAHPDHRATASIAWASLANTDFAATGYSYEVSLQGPSNMLIDITSVINEKIDAMNIYGSQLVANNYIETIIAINKSRTWSLPESVKYAEAFYRWPKQKKYLGRVALSEAQRLYGEHGIPLSLKWRFGWIVRLFR